LATVRLIAMKHKAPRKLLHFVVSPILTLLVDLRREREERERDRQRETEEGERKVRGKRW
jgi:hypothetical protein